MPNHAENFDYETNSQGMAGSQVNLQNYNKYNAYQNQNKNSPKNS